MFVLAVHYLSYDAFNTGQGEALIVRLDDPLQQVITQHLENHAHI